MPDNVKVLAGTGDDTVAPPISTDLIGGSHFQRIKVTWGADGTANETTAATPLPVAQAAATAVDAGNDAGTDEAILAATTNARLVGFSARETTGTQTALFHLRHGTSNAGAILVTVSLAAGESAREWYGPDGIAAASGIWLERESAGAIQVTAYYKVAV